jgi:hypothetical protein
MSSVQVPPGQSHSVSEAAAAFIHRPRQLLIDGEWCGAASGRTFDVVDPATD